MAHSAAWIVVIKQDYKKSKEYEVVRKDLKYSEFCSIECRDKYYKKTCVFCGELFEEETGAFYTKNFEEERILNSFGVKNIYCSWTCFFEYKSGKKIVFCQTCGGKIKKHNPEKNKRYFCNSKCVGKLHSKVMKLKNITGDTYQNSRELLDRPLTLTSLTREVEQC